jgi:hypothetical protein
MNELYAKNMNSVCMFSIGALCICLYTIVNYHNNELEDLQQQLRNAREQINNYKESGAIEKIKVLVKTFPNETSGLKALVYHNELVTPEEAEKLTGYSI